MGLRGTVLRGRRATAVHHLGRLYSLSQRWDTTALVRDGSTGAEIERIPSIFQPVTGASTGYFGDGLRIEARDLATGGVRWTFAPQTRLRTQPLLANGVLYVGTESDELYGIDAATGALRSKRPLGSTPGASPYALLNAGEGVLLVPAGSRLVAFG